MEQYLNTHYKDFANLYKLSHSPHRHGGCTSVHYTVYNPWNNGNRHPRWGVAEIQKMSPPTAVGDAADMQLCVIKQRSPPVLENVAFFVTDLLTLARCAVCILNISVGME